MNSFVIYPAIDLHFGKVVRLRQGKADQETVYGSDPGAVARRWIEQGAEWLHVINLNSAFGEETRENEAAIEVILSSGNKKIKIQLGGGFRTTNQIENALSLGVTRVILGTAVINDPEFGEMVLKEFGPEKIVFGFDAINQELMTSGWQSGSGIPMMSLAKRLSEAGAETLIYTNIQRDGMQTGVDWENAKLLADKTGLVVIASGGVAALDDIRRVREAGLDGVIVGRALYEGNFTLEEAMDVR